VTNQIHYQPAQPAQITAQIDARGSSVPGGIWSRWTTWGAAVLILLLIVLGIALWSHFHRNGSGGKRAGAPGDRCTPQMVGTPARITDRYDRQVLLLNPVLYLPLANPSSDTEPDLSGHHHTAFYELGTSHPDVAKLPNGDLATVFDGYGDYVEVPSSRPLSITDTGCLTVTAWIRPDVLQFPRNQGSGYVYILGKGTAGKQEYALRMYSYSNDETPPRPNRISAYVFNLPGGEGSGAYFQDKVQSGEWIMVTFVVDSRPSAEWPDGYIAIYKNGQRRGMPVSLSQFNVTPEASNAPFRIGTRDLESFFKGAIGKVAVYDSVLSDQQIRVTYEAMVSDSK
jgi:Concanavalin A-like lectin/glucanases superfamily